MSDINLIQRDLSTVSFRQLFSRYTYISKKVMKYGHLYCEAWQNDGEVSNRCYDWQFEWELLNTELKRHHGEAFNAKLDEVDLHGSWCNFGDLCC